MWCQRMPQQMWCRSVSSAVLHFADVAALFENGSTVPSTLRLNVMRMSQPWTTAEEIVLCKVWCDVSVNIANTNTLNFKGFWSEVLACFENEMRENIRRYDVVALKWKQSLRPKIAKFIAVYERAKQRDENGSSDLVVFQNALAEYETQYGQAFTLEPCWKILKNCPVWTELEMPSFKRINN
ncbi:hypothetical protein Tco_1408692 [Tanacetum coccineum]